MPEPAKGNLKKAEALGIKGNADDKDKYDLQTAIRISLIKEYETFRDNNPGKNITPGVAVYRSITEQVAIYLI